MIKKIKLSVTTCYLIPVDNKYLLVDTGYNNDKNRFYKQLEKLRITTKDISYILLTHTHDDHVGLVNEIVLQNTSCKVIMHENAIEKLNTGKNDLSKSSYINKRIATVIRLIRKFSKGGFPIYSTREKDIIISKESSFKNLGIDIDGKIIYTPGHTDDSISVVLDSGICLCGDAAANMLTILGTKHCVIVIEDLKEYYASWTRMLKENITEIYPAHGNTFSVEELHKHLNKQKIQNMRVIKR
jgi:glyoxylase-like metal-dependent hydrolase (beta-lactamase superfamily II)